MMARYFAGISALVLAAMISGCASSQPCNELECQTPEDSRDAMTIWWSPSMASKDETDRSTDFDQVKVPDQ